MEALRAAYADNDVRFFYIYKRLAHPGLGGYVDPFTLEERLAHLAEAKKTLNTQIPWLCDDMDDQGAKALGGAPNSEFILDGQGRIVRMRRWSSPTALRNDLLELVGRPSHSLARARTQATRTPRLPSAPARQTGAIDPLLVPSGIQPLQCEPQTGASPAAQLFYAKLEAHGQRTLFEQGDGALHLVLSLDPVHHVHWNNLAGRVKYEVRFAGPDSNATAASIWRNRISPSHGQGPNPNVDSDSADREFLVDLCGFEPGSAVEVTVHYWACSDTEGWCRPITQSYLVHLKPDLEDRRRNPPFGFRRMLGGAP